MFITVTHFGSGRPFRVAIAAIAYLDIGPADSSALRLIGGETLRVIETPAEIEAACSSWRRAAVEITDEWLSAQISASAPATEAPTPSPRTLSVKKAKA